MNRVDRTLFYNCPPYLLYERPIPYHSIYLLLLYHLVVFECLWNRGWFCLVLIVIIGFCYPVSSHTTDKNIENLPLYNFLCWYSVYSTSWDVTRYLCPPGLLFWGVINIVNVSHRLTQVALNRSWYYKESSLLLLLPQYFLYWISKLR